MIDIFILSLVQGITEFIPVSSSSHLILFSDYVNFENKSLSIDVSLHIGSFLAVVTYFYKEILNFVKNKELFFKVLLSSIPVMISGFILVKTNLIDNFRIIEIIGWTTLLFGILLFISDKFNLEKNLNKDFSYKYALIIGIFQVLSLIPGVSRSGIVITATRFLNFNRVDSAKISFLLSIPTLAAVSIFGLSKHIESQDLNFSLLNFFSILFSFIISFLTIKFFLKYIKRFSLKIFVIYRILLGAIILFFVYL
tara:strand:- start:1298 stop:2056 length:759 start_codon:yes stop_codon:yes gene_type:complete